MTPEITPDDLDRLDADVARGSEHSRRTRGSANNETRRRSRRPVLLSVFTENDRCAQSGWLALNDVSFDPDNGNASSSAQAEALPQRFSELAGSAYEIAWALRLLPPNTRVELATLNRECGSAFSSDCS